MDRAEQLLQAHVEFELRSLRGERFVELVGSEIDHALAAASTLTLDEVMHRDQVKAVAAKYVATFRLPPAIPEIVGEIVTRLRGHEANETRLGDLVDRGRVEELITVLAELRGVRGRVLQGVVENASIQAGVGNLVYETAVGAVDRGRRLIKRVPVLGAGVDAAGKVIAPLAAPVTDKLDQRTRELSEQAAQTMLEYLRDTTTESVGDDDLRAAILELWDVVAERPVREVVELVSDDEVVDVFVAGYDLWLDVRTTAYVTALVDSGVDVFFDTYGATTLDVLLEEFGLGPADLREEALRFAPPIIETLAERGLLAEFLERRLAPFYRSDEARALLDG